jgi:signal transduction histidine kinase
MWLIVFRSMKPIKTLKSARAQLAQGQYENRIVVAGKTNSPSLPPTSTKMADAIESNIRDAEHKSERQQVLSMICHTS